METKRVGASLRFYEDGDAEIECFNHYALTVAQHEALREFMLDQMDYALQSFERERRRVIGDNVVMMVPMSKELN